VTYRLLTGTYVIRYPESPHNGPEPDGDTVKFRPDDPALVEDLARISGTQPGLSRQHRISLRLEAVDALETHFAGAHQELGLANAARDFVLATLGFRDVVFRPDRPNQVESANADELPGWILTNGVEGHGRLVSFAFTGEPPMANGAEVFLGNDLLRRSVNAELLTRGLCYPMLYSTLPTTLRAALAGLSAGARGARAGVWDHSTADPAGIAAVSGLDDVEDAVMWPKLFRRLVSFFAGGNDDLADFDAWLRADRKDRDDALLLLDTGEVGNMHDVIEATTGKVRLNRWPDTFVVLPDPVTIGPAPAPPPRTSAVRIVAALVKPAGDDAGAETVSLLNATGAPLDLRGWEIGDATGRADSLAVEVGPGDVARIVLRNARLADDGGTILVRDPGGSVVDRVAYAKRSVPREGASMTF
jgi:endonuclease YncB( thermonuclease family)